LRPYALPQTAHVNAAGGHSNAINANFGFSLVPRMKRRPQKYFVFFPTGIKNTIC